MIADKQLCNGDSCFIVAGGNVPYVAEDYPLSLSPLVLLHMLESSLI